MLKLHTESCPAYEGRRFIYFDFSKNIELTKIVKDGLSIIIPAYNEEKTLAASVESACAAAIASGSDFEVLIVNDCSTDQTALVAAEVESTNPRIRALSNPTNLGMGGAFKTGLREANYSHAMVFPADNEHPVDGVLPILQARGKADIIIPFVTNPEIRAPMENPRSFLCANQLLSRAPNRRENVYRPHRKIHSDGQASVNLDGCR